MHRPSVRALSAAREDVRLNRGAAASMQDETMTARDEILAALPSIETRSPDGTFSPRDVVDELRRRGSTLAAQTILAIGVGSRPCVPRVREFPRTEELALAPFRIPEYRAWRRATSLARPPQCARNPRVRRLLAACLRSVRHVRPDDGEVPIGELEYVGAGSVVQ